MDRVPRGSPGVQPVAKAINDGVHRLVGGDVAEFANATEEGEVEAIDDRGNRRGSWKERSQQRNALTRKSGRTGRTIARVADSILKGWHAAVGTDRRPNAAGTGAGVGVGVVHGLLVEQRVGGVGDERGVVVRGVVGGDGGIETLETGALGCVKISEKSANDEINTHEGQRRWGSR